MKCLILIMSNKQSFFGLTTPLQHVLFYLAGGQCRSVIADITVSHCGDNTQRLYTWFSFHLALHFEKEIDLFLIIQ
jgi:hypothetical protein